jgi:hypothetical protein
MKNFETFWQQVEKTYNAMLHSRQRTRTHQNIRNEQTHYQ